MCYEEERGEHAETGRERWTETGHILNSLSMKERSVGGVPVRHKGGKRKQCYLPQGQGMYAMKAPIV